MNTEQLAEEITKSLRAPLLDLVLFPTSLSSSKCL